MARFFRFLCLFCAQIPLTFPSLMIFAAWAFAVRGQASRRVSLPRTKSRVQREKLTYFPLLLHVLLPQSVVVCFPERGAVQGRAQRALEVKTGGRRGGRLAPVLPGRLDLVLRTGEKSFSLAPRPKCARKAGLEAAIRLTAETGPKFSLFQRGMTRALARAGEEALGSCAAAQPK